MPERELSIRAMLGRDLSAVMSIDGRCFAIPWSERAFLTELGNPSALYLVGETGGQICGYVGAWVVMDEVHITTLGVNPGLRRQGIAEKLLASLLGEAIRRGARRATLEVRVSNRAAQRLYEKFGFNIVCRRPRYYTDNGEDAVVMWIEDMNGAAKREVLEARFAALWNEHACSGH